MADIGRDRGDAEPDDYQRIQRTRARRVASFLGTADALPRLLTCSVMIQPVEHIMWLGKA